MLNHHLFLLINAAPGLTPAQLVLPMSIARWSVHAVAMLLVFSWFFAGREVRAELVKFAACAAIALLLAVAAAIAVGTAGSQEPAQHVVGGTHYLVQDCLPGLPARQVAMLWAVAFAAFGHGRLSVAAPFLLTLGLAVGWSRIYLGASLPWDVLGALPVAAAAAGVTWFTRGRIHRLALRLDDAYGAWRTALRRPRNQR